MKNNLIELRKIILTFGILSTGSLTLTGCNKKREVKQSTIYATPTLTTETPTIEETNNENIIIDGVEENQSKIFKPGKHYISVRVNQENHYANNIEGNAINNIPEGYEIYTIYPITGEIYKGSQTTGYEVWFVNNETVEVTSSYNEELEIYGFYDFGKVIEKTK